MPISGSNITAILLEGRVLPIASVELHLEGSASSACTAGWFQIQPRHFQAFPAKKNWVYCKYSDKRPGRRFKINKIQSHYQWYYRLLFFRTPYTQWCNVCTWYLSVHYIRVYRARNFSFKPELELSSNPDICLSPRQAQLRNLTSFRSQAESSSEIQPAFKPEQSVAQILSWLPSRAEPPKLGLFCSSWLKLQQALYNFKQVNMTNYSEHGLKRTEMLKFYKLV